MLKEAEVYKSILNDYLVIDDWQGVELIMAAVATHWVPGNMLWFRTIGASGSGKSEILRSIEYNWDKYKDEPEKLKVIPADSFTPGAIRGGYLKDSPRMLELWNNKLVVTKDFAGMVTKKREDKGEVFGLLRCAWDGTLSAFYGSDDAHVKLKFHFDWIVASTSMVERQRSLEAELGSRFVDLRWRTPIEEKAAIYKAMCEDESSSNFRKLLGEQMEAFMDIVKDKKPEYSPSEWLASIAMIAAKLRTPVYRDINHNIQDIPTPEIGTRFAQGLQRIAKGLSIMGVEDYKPYIRRLALDCLSNLRRAIVETYLGNPTSTTGDIVKRLSGVSHDVIERELDNLRMLGWNKESYETLRDLQK